MTYIKEEHINQDQRNVFSRDEISSLTTFATELADLSKKTYKKLVDSKKTAGQKSDWSLVTEIDRGIEQELTTYIKRRRPNDGILGEEFGITGTLDELVWIIDPIDGTEELVFGLPNFGTIIGLWYKGFPLVGVIDHPEMELRVSAGFGLGCFKNGSQCQKIQVHDFKKAPRMGISPACAFEVTGDQKLFNKLVKAFPNFRSYWTVYSHSLTATGGLHLAVEWNLRSWDIAATEIIITESGGVFKILKGDRTRILDSIFGVAFGDEKWVLMAKELFVTDK